ncbi:MAG TPA: ISL3 family transposase [Streptosporangiaceae bacterium]|nr:ISL3 family transposase [Streptosporangiaceae bacterium]
MLFGVEGLQVIEAEAGPDGTLTVWAVTDHPGAAACPDCGTVSSRPHDRVLTCPRDVRRGLDRVRLCWLKRRWKCAEGRCGRKTFTESLPAIPPRHRVTGRVRDQAGHEVAERGITPAEAARGCGVSWPVAHDAFAAAAGPVLDQPPAPVAHLGIDEHRRGRPRWRIDEDSGEYVLLADRWHTCFFDLAGDQGLLGQVEGRTADDAAYWMWQAGPAWRDHVKVVAIDMCSIYAAAVRRMLPQAQVVVDFFHVVQLAVKMTGDVRRRVVRGKYGRRGRSGDTEYGIKGLLVRNLEHLRPGQFAKVMDVLGGDRHGQQILAAWIGKEKLRDALNLRAAVTGSTPCERDVRDRLFRFYDWCARNDDIPELLTLARTISRWEDEITAAVLTGVSNARSESLNRIAKLEARLAYSFRNPVNQRRRVRMACTRGTRRSQAATARRSRLATGRKHDPG